MCIVYAYRSESEYGNIKRAKKSATAPIANSTAADSRNLFGFDSDEEYNR